MSRLTPAVTDADHRLGPDDAPVILVEYGDFECPHCGAAHPIVAAVQKGMGPRMQFVFRHFPLAEIHPHAHRAAEAAESAGVQGKFWEMHDILFENQDALGDADLARYAQALGVDLNRFAAELSAGTHTARVRKDFLSGVRSGVNGTPTFFVNGVRYDRPWDVETLLKAVKLAASEARVGHPT